MYRGKLFPQDCRNRTLWTWDSKSSQSDSKAYGFYHHWRKCSQVCLQTCNKLWSKSVFPWSLLKWINREREGFLDPSREDTLKCRPAFIPTPLIPGDVIEATAHPNKCSLKENVMMGAATPQGMYFRLLNSLLYLGHQHSGTSTAQV